MRVFGQLFKARDKPQDALNGSGYSFLFGRSTAGQSVNAHSAMQLSAVYACVRILAESIAALPLHFYRYTDTVNPSRAFFIKYRKDYLQNPIGASMTSSGWTCWAFCISGRGMFARTQKGSASSNVYRRGLA